jgi:hypothetical protein
MEHVVRTRFEGDWDCSCGRTGSAPEYRVDEASDKHINYGAGDTRTDRSKG